MKKIFSTLTFSTITLISLMSFTVNASDNETAAPCPGCGVASETIDLDARAAHRQAIEILRKTNTTPSADAAFNIDISTAGKLSPEVDVDRIGAGAVREMRNVEAELDSLLNNPTPGSDTRFTEDRIKNLHAQTKRVSQIVGDEGARVQLRLESLVSRYKSRSNKLRADNIDLITNAENTVVPPLRTAAAKNVENPQKYARAQALEMGLRQPIFSKQ